MILIDANKIKECKLQNIGYFRFKKLEKDVFLLTNDVGGFVFLSQKDFGDFIMGKLHSGESYEKLVEKGFIIGEKYSKNMEEGLMKKNDFLNYGPSLHIIVLTLRCNHKCRYCHAAATPMSAKNSDMDLDTALKVVDTIFYTSSNNITIEFQGGEPLVNFPILKEIVKYAQEKASILGKHVEFALVSNLSLMTDEILNFLTENDFGISTSLDGDEELHNYNRVYKEGNSFEKVAYWIQKINTQLIEKNCSKKKVGALLTVTKKTLSKYKEVIDTYRDLGLDSIFLRPLNPYGFASADLKNLGYTSEEFIEYYKKSMDYILEINKNGTHFKEIYSVIFLSKILTDRDPNFLDERSPCGAGIGQVAYNYDGKIYTCDEGRMLGKMGINNFEIGSVAEGEGREIYHAMMENENTKITFGASIIDVLPGYNDSVYKPYLGVCPIYNFKSNGNIYPNYSTNNKRKIDEYILDYLFKNIYNAPENKKVFEDWVNNQSQGLFCSVF